METKRSEILNSLEQWLKDYRDGKLRTGEVIMYISNILTDVYNMKEKGENLDGTF